jgi:hydroxymethylbilane synthase
MLPAVGQGALGLEARADDRRTLDALAQLDDLETHAAVLAERAMLASLRGGCLAPVGAWGRIDGGRLLLSGVVLSLDGAERLTAEAAGDLASAVALGQSVAADLLSRGAGAFIAASRNRSTNET